MYPEGVFKSMGLWRATSPQQRDAITSFEKLEIGEHCLVKDSGLYVCVGLSVTGSDWKSVSTASYYHGYVTGSLQWTSTTWDDITTVTGDLQDVAMSGIGRVAGKFYFTNPGTYKIDAVFNSMGVDNFIGFRVRASNNTTLLQHTDYVNLLSQHRSTLVGVFPVTASNDWIGLEYAQVSGSTTSWEPFDPLDGENMRTVNISITSIELP